MHLCTVKLTTTSSDVDYIDCGPLLSSCRKPPPLPPDVGSTSTAHERAPLLSKSAAVVQNNSSVEDLSPDGSHRPVMYRCLSRSCSIGSQLSAAASSPVHDEYVSDLALDVASCGSSHGEYVPMSRIATAQRDDSGTKEVLS